MTHCLQFLGDILQVSNNWYDMSIVYTKKISKGASIMPCTRNCVNVSPHGEFTLRNNLPFVYAFCM